MSEKMLHVMIKEPGKVPEFRNVPDELKAFQDLVGGYIETVTIATDLLIVCNEECRILGMPYNCTVGGYDFFGPIVIVGFSGDEFTDLPLSDYEMKLCFETLFEEPAMKNAELIRALREKPSRDNRELLDEAADAIETLEMQIEKLKARLDASEDMRISLPTSMVGR